MSDNFPVVAASSAARTKLANECVALIRDYDFDGIDIDWEYPGYGEHSGTPQDKENFNLLLSEVRSKLDALGAETGKYYGLTAALPCGPSNISNMDIPHVSSVLDELLLMTYDFHGSWESITGVNAPLYYQGFGDMDFSLDACVQNWKAGGAPSSKISIGLAFYGRSFAYASGLNQPHQGADTNNWGEDEGLPQYFNIVDRLPAMTSVRHDVSKTQFAFFKNEHGFVSYDDERSICEKTEYAIANGLKGFLIWELTGDLMQDLSTPLLDMVNAKVANPNINCAGGSYTTAPSPSQTWSPTAKPTTQSPTSTPTIGTTPPSPSSGPSCPSGYSGMLAVDECTGFRYCTKGAFSSVKIACADGTLFDNQIQNCDHADNVNCANTMCQDTSLTFPINGRKRKCKWVNFNTDVRCGKRNVAELCPLTCGNDCTPFDTAGKFQHNGKLKACAFVAKKAVKRCLNNNLRSHCPVTCSRY